MLTGAKPYVEWHTFSTFPISHHVFELAQHVALLCSRNWQRGVGWGGVGWGGDVNVRLKLTQIGSCWRQQSRPQSVQKRLTVSMPGSINTFDPCNGDGKKRCVLTCWKKQHRSTCTMITETGKAKKGPDFVWKGCQTQEKWLFFLRVLLWDGYETLKRLSFFDHGDAPTRAIPHPAGSIWYCLGGWANVVFFATVTIYSDFNQFKHGGKPHQETGTKPGRIKISFSDSRWVEYTQYILVWNNG